MHIVHTEASRGWGGQEIRILTEAQGMASRGHTVTLLCPPDARIFSEALQRGVPVVSLPLGKLRLSAVAAVYKWLRDHPVDVINTHSSTDTWLVAIACLLLRRPPPLVRTRHISAPIGKGHLTRWLYQTATARIVTTGEKLREQLIIDNGYDPTRMVSIPTGIDVDHFVPGDRVAARGVLKLPDDSLLIGSVATLRSWKGHSYLLDAFARLSDRRARLVIVGDGPQRDALQQQAAALGIADRVVMPGNQRLVLPWLQALDIFVLPSYANEGVPQAIMQAMSCALPVISTPIGSISEIVSHERTGLLVGPKNADALTAALTQLSTDAGLRRRLGLAARETALADFRLERMVDRMQAVFADVVAKARH